MSEHNQAWNEMRELYGRLGDVVSYAKSHGISHLGGLAGVREGQTLVQLAELLKVDGFALPPTMRDD